MYLNLEDFNKMRKKHRNLFVDFMFNNLKKLNYNDNVLSFIIKSIHCNTPFYCLGLFMILPFNKIYIPATYLLSVFILYLYFDGCFLTMLEYKLNNHNFVNIIDPFLNMTKLPINSRNRNIYTLYISEVYFYAVFILLLLRYYKQDINDYFNNLIN